MKSLKKYIFAGVALTLMASCSDFLDTLPSDALTPETTWKTEQDAQKFLIGCYDGWEKGEELLYMDCASDFGYNNFQWEGYKDFGNGTLSQANPGTNFYDYTIIRRCNTLLENIDKIAFSDEKVKKDLIAQARVIRAYRYFKMNWLYGGVAQIGNYGSAQEAQVERATEAQIREFIHAELDECTSDLSEKPAARGRIAQGAALAIRMREALYYGDWQVAKEKAQAIIDLSKKNGNLYELEKGADGYSRLFQVAGQDSKEIILAVQYINSTKPLGVIGQMYNNGDGGWSSIVPTYQLIDTYEMKSGLTITESGSGYDPAHPFKNRDPRLALTVIYPGADYIKADGTKAVFNTLDKTIDGSANANFMTAADNASKTGLTWNKYLGPITQYADIWKSNACPIVFRYAEVLLTWAEAENELNGPSEDVYAKIDEVRTRVGMPKVDRNKYNSKETLRELIWRERGVEFAGEGIRRADILRWKTSDGKMLAEKVLNVTLERRVGTVDMKGSDPESRATIKQDASAADKKIEDRKFEKKNRYFPFGQEVLDKNPKLTQNEGY
ncbi:RagB/SusD family nutrient uptake outer membrane protein [Phocaeicola faecicola]|uniref:RagB/SusD family nutrient uptake outer membrane protein n=1 Tax=Phocaeicola faecicola TaxID=2739389 RepID=UPI002A82D420|nr:RagB/SusD family nutrient uptake outer membrane protein [Phocaeicola faecicola]MDY4871129.1 RagB/SusD family nutrient uptake outer membrane protein [Phocaeicola faecicola]